MTQPRTTLTEALHSRAFVEMLPRLVSYAARRLRRFRWAQGVDREPAKAEVEDLVHDTVEACLRGAWVWPDDMDLETFLQGVMWSQLGHRHRTERTRRTLPVKDALAVAADDPPIDDRLDQRRLLAGIERALSGDPEIEAVLGALDRGHVKRAALASALGWTPERVKAVRVRMNRRLAAAGLYVKEEEAP